MSLYSRVELDRFIITGRAYETCAEQCVIPIEDNCCLMKFRLIKRSQPNLLIGQLTKEIPSNTIICSTFLYEVQ